MVDNADSWGLSGDGGCGRGAVGRGAGGGGGTGAGGGGDDPAVSAGGRGGRVWVSVADAGCGGGGMWRGTGGAVEQGAADVGRLWADGEHGVRDDLTAARGGGKRDDRAANRQHEAIRGDRKSTRLNSSHSQISYAVFCLKKKKQHTCRQDHSYHSRHVCHVV